MAKSVEAYVTPELLVWARKQAQLDPVGAAKRIGVETETLIAWEEGDGRPTFAKLKKISEVYRKSLTLFYLPRPPRAFTPIRDFRQLGSPVMEDNLRKEIALAQQRREATADLLAMLGVRAEIDLPIVTMADNVEIVAGEVRKYFGVTTEQQTSAAGPEEVFEIWRHAIESKKILVLLAHYTHEIANYSGFAITEEQPFTILINHYQHSKRHVLFTLLHELAHVLLRAPGVSLLSSEHHTELFCNALAAAILLPADDFFADPLARDLSEDNWQESRLRALSETWKVSQDCVLRRLHTFDRVSWDFYLRYKLLFDSAWKPVEIEKAGPALYFSETSKKLGSFFPALAFSARARNLINSADLAGFLGVQVKHLRGLEEKVLSGARP